MAIQDEIDIFYDMQGLRENGPRWKLGDWIIIEHLTKADMQSLGENPEPKGVVRMSLANDKHGRNSRKLVDVVVKRESHDFISRALIKLTRLGEGFKMATALRDEEIGMVVRPPHIQE